MRKVMKEIRLGEEKEFDLELPIGSKIRRFEMGVEEQKVSTMTWENSASYIVGPDARMLKEIPILFVEVRPDAPMIKRKFKIVPIDEPLESEYDYVACTYSHAASCWIHLFEQPFSS